MRSARFLALLVACLFLFSSGSLNAQHGGPAPKHPDPSLTGPPISFYTELSPDEQSANVESPAIGRADFTLDRQTLELSWRITFKDLSSRPRAASLHGPQTPGGNAGVLIDLAPGGVTSPLTGSAVINDGTLRYLLTDRTYVNITTETYKTGELRGQIKRMRSDAATTQ